jgi:hypothetical protein
VQTSLAVPPLFAALDGARNVLLAGAGGGFDVYAALPLAMALRSGGIAVHLGNLSFTQLESLDLSAWAAGTWPTRSRSTRWSCSTAAPTS